MARLLDLTRLASRHGRGPLTGVDRVEAAYLDELLARDEPAFGLLRVPLGYLLIDRSGMIALRDRMGGRPTGPSDIPGRLLRLRQPARARLEADLRRLALDGCPPWRLASMLRRHLPQGASYLNTGHSNLTDKGLRRLRAAGVRIAVFVHDVIPLDHPEFARAGVPAVFARKIAAVSAHADLVIHSTADARRRTEARLPRVPAGIVAPLGVGPLRPDPTSLPPGLPPPRPYFVALGTLEPRKNHALLLDVWDALHARLPEADVPALLILGTRGWADPALFRRLDAGPWRGRTVFEWPGLGDGAVASLLAGAEALLFPSFAEGFGLPPVEAAALGVPVLSSPLPAIRETLSDYPVYLDPADRYLWTETIAAWGQRRRGQRGPGRPAPTWEDHFRMVFSCV
ncbi:glycosyltransferase [Rhodobacter sp. CZR27]|uniref:glycosyltransferase n=1 Tax=Rhodobacter sp. CZR27 TaxID=2033869 RepID=UPI000BBEC5F7|nr:glycosyltransferase [Rhodobacter sp. CZR27]